MSKAAQDRREAEIVTNFGVCNLNPRQKSSKKSASASSRRFDPAKLNLVAFKENMDEDFYNAGLLQALSCMFDFVIQTAEAPSTGEGLPAATQAIKDYITNLRRIGAESVEGVALMAGVGAVNDFVIIKAPREPQYDGLLHEFFVGVVALNPLRASIPNFMYTLGGFRCGSPKLGGKDKKQVLEWCNPTSPTVNYVIYEKIKGKGFGDMVADGIGIRDYLSYYIQVILATQMGVEEYAYTHYDLHDGNVLMREVAENADYFWIPYVLAGEEKYYVKTNRVATIIDYGRVHIKHTDGKHYGYFGLEGSGLLPDKARPLYDLYKLLGFSAYTAHQGGKTALLRDLVPLFRFFRPSVKTYGDLRALLDKEIKTYFELSSVITPNEAESNLRDLLGHIADNYAAHFEQLVAEEIGDEEPMLTCKGVESGPQSCDTVEALIGQLSLSVTPAGKSKSKTVAPTRLVTQMRNTKARLFDIKQQKKLLEADIEQDVLRQKLTQLETEFDENYEEIRDVLKERLRNSREEIAELSKQADIPFDSRIGTSPAENRDILMRFIDLQTAQISLNLYLRNYARDFAILHRAEKIAGLEPTPEGAYTIDVALAKKLKKRNREMTNYLTQFRDDMLDADSQEMKNSLIRIFGWIV